MRQDHHKATPKQSGLAAWEVSVLVAAVAGGFAYVSASQGPWLFEGDGHACMGDGAEACSAPPFAVAWIAQWAIIGLFLSPIAVLCGWRHGRRWAAWSLFALSALPSILSGILLRSFLFEAFQTGRTWMIVWAAIPSILWLAGATLSALWIARGQPYGTARLTTALVAGGYFSLVVEIALFAFYMEVFVMR